MSDWPWLKAFLESPWQAFLLGGLTALGGAWLGWWAFFADKARGRRRCPKCWYDLRGTPGMRCSECGYLAKHEKALHKTRRRWRAGMAAFLLLIVAAGISLAPKIRRDGWLSLAPTAALILLVPEVGRELSIDGQGNIKIHPIVEELERRDVAAASLSDWQWKFVLERKGILHTRPRWPETIPLMVCTRLPRWFYNGDLIDGEIRMRPHLADGQEVKATFIIGGCGNGVQGLYEREGCQRMGTVKWPARAVFVDGIVALATFSWDEESVQRFYEQDDIPKLWSGTFRLPVEIVNSLEEAIEPAHDPELTELLKKAVQITIRFGKSGYENAEDVFMWMRLDRSQHPRLDELAFGFRLDFLRAGELVESLPLPPMPALLEPRPFARASLDRVHARDLTAPDAAQLWRVRLRGDGELALRDWDKPKFWAGELTFALSEVLRKE